MTTSLAARPGVPPPAVRRVRLPGGRTLFIRPMRREDAPAMSALFAGLSHEDTYRRFFGARPPPETFVVEMAAADERGGVGLVAMIAEEGDAGAPERLVAEATYEVLADGDGELGITVAAGARGWLGPYLLDALLEAAAARGVPNLEADVLLTNTRMLAMLRRRGCAIVGFDDHPPVVRVAIGTTGRIPSWPPASTQRRVLIETPGGRWHAHEALRAAGYRVMACAGPHGGGSACRALRDERCPLAAEADVIVDAVPGEAGRALLDAHRRLHPGPRLCAEVGPDDPDPGPGVVAIPRGTPAAAVVALVRSLVPSR